MDHAIVGANQEGRITYWNDYAEEFFGYAASEALDKPVDLIVPEDIRDRHWEGFHRAMGGGERRLVDAVINIPVRVRSGEVLAFPARFIHLVGPRGEMVAAMAVFARRAGNEEPWSPVEP